MNREVIDFFKDYVKNDLDIGYIKGYEFIRDIFRKKMEENKQFFKEE